MCSAPSSSMMSVPDAALLPITPRPVILEKSAMMPGGNPCGKTGNGRASTTPIISQWPVTESLPAEASAIRPTAPVALPAGGAPPNITTRSRPSARSVGTRSGTRRAMWPSVSLPSSPYCAASGSSPMPAPSSTITMARLNAAVERDGMMVLIQPGGSRRRSSRTTRLDRQATPDQAPCGTRSPGDARSGGSPGR